MTSWIHPSPAVDRSAGIRRVPIRLRLGRPWTSSQPPRAMWILADSLKRAAAMYMAGIDGEKEHANAKKILLEMGEFFQIQHDYLDLFGDPSVTGKVGTDIQDNKCSWLVVQCLQRATPVQYQILKENYGQKEAEKVARVKALYEELDLQAVFLQYEEDSYSHIMALIEQYAAPLPPAIFLGLARTIYKRKK
uniref:(2E,6E)-farnesyl diphosphate synthase n=1 Tax=Macaca mulatta TaxID=9544 RepID=A0A5F8AT43_MACMU